MRIRLALLVAVLTLAAAPTAFGQESQEPTFTLSFDDMVPGETRSDSVVIRLDNDAEFRGVTWIERSGELGDTVLVVALCLPGRPCSGTETPVGARFTAGDVEVVVTATLPADADPGGDGQVQGRLSFAAAAAAADDVTDLPFTGARVISLTAWAVALVCVGLLIVTLARRGEKEELS